VARAAYIPALKGGRSCPLHTEPTLPHRRAAIPLVAALRFARKLDTEAQSILSRLCRDSGHR